MSQNFAFSIKTLRFDENYRPSNNTRITTNFANLARGERRYDNLRDTLRMINQRFNALAHWDNPNGDRYSVELDIVSVDMDIEGNGRPFPTIEMLQTTVLDHQTNQRIEGMIGNNFSSYIRDYDFSVLLLDHNKGQSRFTIPESFGTLHGNIFKHFVQSTTFQRHFSKLPVICLSVAESKVYQRSNNQHPVLGVEYQPNESSLTEHYFQQMGLQVRYFMPQNSKAPLAFYFFGDLLNDYSNLELISIISTMETFQKIYRPEIYHANTPAGERFKPSLQHQDHSLTPIQYDREERSQLAIKQGKFTEEHFIKPYQNLLEQWSANAAH